MSSATQTVPNMVSDTLDITSQCFTKMPLTGCCLPQFLAPCHHSECGIVKNYVWTLVPANKSAHGFNNLNELGPVRSSTNTNC